jgi:hypothetical protein
MAQRSINHATKFDNAAVPGALHNAPVMDGNGGVHQIATQRSQARQRSILVTAGKPAVSDYVRDQYGGEFPGFGHRLPLWGGTLAQLTRSELDRIY